MRDRRTDRRQEDKRQHSMQVEEWQIVRGKEQKARNRIETSKPTLLSCPH
jgi:hypothetical protein